MESAPRTAIILAWVSNLREDDERGVEGQVQDGCGRARRVGWGVGPRLRHVVIENNEAGSGLRWQPAVRLRHGRAARRPCGGSSLAASTRSSSAADAVCTASAWF
jgi:hypothetical protein